MRDSYQFTAELRKVVHSLPPRAARAACQALRNPRAAASAASVGRKRGRDVDAPRFGGGQGSGIDAAGDADDDEELPYTTQVRAAGIILPLVLIVFVVFVVGGLGRLYGP